MHKIKVIEREKQIERNPDIVLLESEWKKEYEKMPAGFIVDLFKLQKLSAFSYINKDLSSLYGRDFNDALFLGNDRKLVISMKKDGIDLIKEKTLDVFKYWKRY